MTGTTYTREAVSQALNQAADVIAESHDCENSETIAADSIADLIVSLTLHWLDRPDDSLDEAIAAEYTTVEPYFDDLEEGQPVPEKGSPEWNAAVAAEVKGWISLIRAPSITCSRWRRLSGTNSRKEADHGRQDTGRGAGQPEIRA